MLDDGHFRAVRDGADEALAARACKVNVLRERKQNGNRLAVGWDDLNRVFGKTAMRDFACINHGLGDDLIRVQRLLAPRSIVALPDLKHRLAASAVTFGRDS